jgi:thioredoxin 1
MLLEVTNENFNDVVAKPAIVVLDFWNSWCGPCIKLNPIIKSFAENNQHVVVGKINTNEQPDLTGQFNVHHIPTIVFFKGGTEVKRVVGYVTEVKLKEIVDSLS